jgi:hypothetical protein
MLLRVGSRGSRLALTQASLASEHFRRPGREIALVPITTAGDRDRRRPFGDRRAWWFVKELEEALLAGRIDAAVHSAKDCLDGHGRSRRRCYLVRGIRGTRSAAPPSSVPRCESGPPRYGAGAVLALGPELSVEPLPWQHRHTPQTG